MSFVLAAFALISACRSDGTSNVRTDQPLVSTPPTRPEQGDPSTTLHNGELIGVIREACVQFETPCTALSIRGAGYVRGGWPLNDNAIQALGGLLGVSEDGASARELFNVDTVVGYRSSPDAAWEALIASEATAEPANQWLLCSALKSAKSARSPKSPTSPDAALVTCDGVDPADLAAAGLSGHWRGAAEQVLDATCPELPDILRRLSDNAVGAGDADEWMAYAVAALVDAQWIELGCQGHLTPSP